MAWIKYVAGIVGGGCMLVFVAHMITFMGLLLIDIEAMIRANSGDWSWLLPLLWIYGVLWGCGAIITGIGTWET